MWFFTGIAGLATLWVGSTILREPATSIAHIVVFLVAAAFTFIGAAFAAADPKTGGKK
jgi:uncharacterized membrane protein HdeD (DUF308 family)